MFYLRQIEGGVRKANQAPKLVYGCQLFDKVQYRRQECFIWGRRSSGYFVLKTFDGNVISNGINYKKLILFKKAETILKERRGVPLMTNTPYGVHESRVSTPKTL